MIEINTFITVLIVHWVADFIFQTRWMATNKSSSNIALGSHILVYTLVMSVFGIWFAVVNGILHFIIDYFTSRGTSYLWKKKETHMFFILIGLDQLLHSVCLIYTYNLIR